MYLPTKNGPAWSKHNWTKESTEPKLNKVYGQETFQA